VAEATVTALDNEKRDDSENDLFYTGILLGIAGSGAFALIPEISRLMRPGNKPQPTPPVTPPREKSFLARYGAPLAVGAVLGALITRRRGK
jgi:hypothetical protein